MSRKRTLILGGLLAGICFMIGLLGSSQLPKLRAWILVTIEKTSRDHLPVRILPGSLDVNFFPLGTTLKSVKIAPKPEIEAFIDPLEIEELRLNVSLWQLMQGRLRLSAVEVSGAKISVRVPATEKKSKDKPLEGMFDILQQIPLNRLALDRISIRANLADPKLLVAIDELELEAEKRMGGLALVLNSGSTYVGEPGAGGAGVSGEAQLDSFIGRDRVLVSALKFRRGDSFAVASGELEGDTEALAFPTIDLSTRSEWQLEPMRNWAVKTFPQAANLPPLKGSAFIEGKYSQNAKTKKPVAEFQFKTKDLQESKLYFGTISGSGNFKDGVIRIPKTTLENSSGVATVSDLEVKPQEEATTLSGKLSTKGLNLHELLKNLGVPNVPVFLSLSADVPCTGQITPTFGLNCHGHAKGDNLLINDDLKTPVTIVAIKTFEATGQFTVDKEKVSYAAELAMPESKGRSQGTIGYATGFDIAYEADKFTIKDVANLANLKLEGTAKVKGTTRGDSKHGVIALDLDGTDMWFENYWLGNAKATIGYKEGVLTFTNLHGYHTVSRYNADVKVDLLEKQIAVTGRIPFFDSRDLLKAFSRRVQLPFPVTGTGQAQIKLSGPLQFNKLTYDLKSTLFKGSVAGETFDQARFDVKANKGEVKAERVIVTKGPASIQLTGEGHPDGNVETVIRGRGIRLEDTTAVLNSGLALSGQVDFDMDLKGYVLAPDTTLKGTLTKTSIGDQSMPDSKFSLKFTKKTIEGSGFFLGDVVKADLVFPLDPSAPFRLKATTQDWNFAPLFSAIGGPGTRKNFEGRLTSAIDLTSPTGGFWNASGSIDIEKFSLSRGSLTLRSHEPLSMSMKDGLLRTQKFELLGDNIFLRVSDNPRAGSKLDLQVNGKMDLSLISLLTPFFEDLRGLLSFTFNIKGDQNTTGILGSAYIEKGYLKLFDFQHPFEDIRADILFNQKKILFNSIRAQFADGRLQASGGMELKGPKNYPLNVAGSFDKVTLNLPDKFKTMGSGELSITGNWFPFLLKGNYEISDGLISKDIGGDQAPSDGIRRDNYLPEFLLQENFVPLLLDLQINFPRGIALKNENIEGRTIGQLAVKGKLSKPSILGSVTTDKDTRAIFRDNVFEITSSNIQFNDPNEINPKLYVAARTRVQDYDVNLVVTGTGQKPEFSWSSIPQLPEKEIISLLALGATDSQLDKQISSTNQASNSGLQIGTGMIRNNPVSNLVKEKFGFDVQFSTGYDDTANTQQKVIVSRQLSPRFDVSGSWAFGRNRATEARLRYRLNEKMSLMGVYQGREYTETGIDTTILQKNPNTVGVDLEYKVEFK